MDKIISLPIFLSAKRKNRWCGEFVALRLRQTSRRSPLLLEATRLLLPVRPSAPRPQGEIVVVEALGPIQDISREPARPGLAARALQPPIFLFLHGLFLVAALYRATEKVVRDNGYKSD